MSQASDSTPSQHLPYVHILMVICIVGGNAVSAFLSWRLQATNACDVTLVWKSGFESVSQYGISFRCGPFGSSNMAILKLETLLNVFFLDLHHLEMSASSPVQVCEARNECEVLFSGFELTTTCSRPNPRRRCPCSEERLRLCACLHKSPTRRLRSCISHRACRYTSAYMHPNQHFTLAWH